MLRLFFAIFIFLALVGASNAQDRPATRHKYEDDVAKFALDVPQPGGVLLVGSSIFRKWTTFASDLAPIPVTNRAFGGSRTSDQLLFFDEVVPSSHARIVVWYCGSNDVKGGVPSETVLANTAEWIGRTQSALPDARIILVSVIRAIQKREDGQLGEVDAVNSGLRKLSETLSGVDYVDINPALESASGEALPGCYVSDKLHLSPEGYRKMAAALRPSIEKTWNGK